MKYLEHRYIEHKTEIGIRDRYSQSMDTDSDRQVVFVCSSVCLSVCLVCRDVCVCMVQGSVGLGSYNWREGGGGFKAGRVGEFLF